MAVIKWGIIGVGNVTEVKSGPGFQKATNSELVAIMRRNGDLAKDYAERHGVPRWYDDADALINDPEVDAVYIATPPHVHKDYTLRCAAAGKPVYVEKPMALNYAECQMMVDACKGANVPLWVAFYRRALPRFLKIKEIVQSGQIGEVRSVNMQIYAPPPTFEPGRVPWRLRPEMGGAGGRFIDLAPHMLDYLDFVLGSIASAQGMAVNQGKAYPADDHVVAHFQFESGVVGVGDWCFTAAHHVDQTQIVGTEGTISFACFNTSPVTITRGETVETLDLDNPPHVQQLLIQTIVDELNGGDPCPSSGTSAMRTTWVTGPNTCIRRSRMMPIKRTINHAYAPSHSWTCISRPDDPHKTLVNETGGLLYDFLNWVSGTDNYYFRRVFSFGLQTSEQPIRITQSTESARCPFVKTIIAYPLATLELVAFAHVHDSQRTDIVLWTIRAEQVVDTVLWVDGQSLGEVFVLPDVRKPHHRIYTTDTQHWSHIVAGLRGSTPQTMPPESQLTYISVPYTLELSSSQHYGPTPRYRTPILTVSPGAPLEGALIFPIGHDLSEDYDLAWAQQALETERRFWADYLLQPLDWLIPDDDIMDMVTASARNIMQARDVKNGLPEFQVGPTCYRGLWVVDGHFILEAARYLGHATATEQGVNALLRRVRDDGSITQLPHHIKETGISITTFVRLCELDDDLLRLRQLWPVIQGAVEHIQSLRNTSKQLGEDASDYNLMPPAFGDGGLGGHRAEYTTALWILVGLKQATRAADLLGFTDDAAACQAQLNDMLAVFREKAARDIRHLPNGTPYLPMAMPGASSQHRDEADFDGEISPYMHLKPGTATWALAHAIYPGEVFAPDDPIVQKFCELLDQLDDQEGIPAETGWLPHNGLWTYAASFYAHVWLYAGRPDKAIDYLYSFANHASTTRVWREEQSFRSATYEQIIGDMPHNWASAEFIRLTRHLLVFEKGDQLHILPALPPEWIKPNATIHLQDTPTRCGSVNMTLSFDADANGMLTMSFDTERSSKPEEVILHIPDGMSPVQSNGMSIPTANGKLTLPFVPQQTIHLKKE